MTHICKTGMSNCVLISPPLKKPFGLVELGWTGYPMCLLFLFFFSPFLFICTTVQHFALFKHQQHSSCEKLCQLCFRELARKQKKKLSRTTCAFSWETASPVAGTEWVPCWHGGALYNRVGAACPRHLILPLTLCWRSWCRGFTHCSSGL